MLALAAARLGLRCHVFSPDPDSPAFDVVRNATCAEYADMEALDLFATDVDVVTYEFENVPAAAAMSWPRAARCCPTARSSRPRRTGSPRRISSTRLGIGTADFADVDLGRIAARRRSRGSASPPC